MPTRKSSSDLPLSARLQLTSSSELERALDSSSTWPASVKTLRSLPRMPAHLNAAPSLTRATLPTTSRNVLTNAIKFTPQGGRIEVAVDRLRGEARIRVKDSGPGIAADQLEAVFERFRRLDSRPRGYGLGLYISRSIVDAHDGRIWVESEVGAGSTFYIALPARDA